MSSDAFSTSSLKTARGVVMEERREGSGSGSVPCPCASWCFAGSLNPFHHDLRSRLLGGEAACEGVPGWLAGSCCGGPAWLWGAGASDVIVDDGAEEPTLLLISDPGREQRRG
jgi:hypothetical protein